MSASALWYAGLPDGVTDVLVGPQGGLFVAGFDSLKRRCLVLYAPPFGLPAEEDAVLFYVGGIGVTPAASCADTASPLGYHLPPGVSHSQQR